MSYSYNHYKSLYESVKPIRGRSTEVRPIGKRRRDWETIRMAGDVVECVLYQTPVVRYFPDGSIGLQCGGWATPSTAEFMHEHSPFYSRKKSNRIWVSHSRESTAYPLPSCGEVKFILTADNKWAPHEPISITKKVIDRNKAKEARAPYKPFLNFVETFLKVSDGWLSDATQAAVGKVSETMYYGDVYDFGLGTVRHPESEKLLKMIAQSGEEDYLRAMCALLQCVNPTERSVARTVPLKSGGVKNMWNLRYDHKLVRAKLYRIIEKCEDVYNEVEMEYK